MDRLTARFWVDAYLAQLWIEGIPAFVTAHGDDTAGSILVKVNSLDGRAAVYQRSYQLLSDVQDWQVLAEGVEADVDAAIARQQSFDPDLWVLEVEDRQGRHLLDRPGLA
jgi:hypothetical protein